MTRSENALKLNSSLDWSYFGASSNNHHCLVPDYIFTVDVAQSAPTVTKMVSMTKFDAFKTAKRWLCVLEEELLIQLTPTTWFKRANA